jgi:hypothetical protein
MCGLVCSSYPMCGFSRIIRCAVLCTQVIRCAGFSRIIRCAVWCAQVIRCVVLVELSDVRFMSSSYPMCGLVCSSYPMCGFSLIIRCTVCELKLSDKRFLNSSYPICGFNRIIRCAVLCAQVIRRAVSVGLSDVRFGVLKLSDVRLA